MPPVPKERRDPYPGGGAYRGDPNKVAAQRPRPNYSEARAPPGRIYTFSTLPEKGIDYSRNHIRRLVEAGRFPEPFYLSERRPAWSEAQLDQWICEREANREQDRAERDERIARLRAARKAERDRGEVADA